MPAPDRMHISDLRGVTRLVIDATAGVTGIVEQVHRTIQLRPGPLGDPAPDRPRGITGFVYRSIHGGIRLVGKGVDSSLAPIAALLPEGKSSPVRDAFLSALNGVYGDHLARTKNPLAVDMSLRYRGSPLDLENPVGVLGPGDDADSADRLLLMVHGLCLNDRHWTREGHNHGTALAGDLGCVPFYLRYNTGLHIDQNGIGLANILETLFRNWPRPVRELVIIGHSMGGLVARSACQHGLEAGHTWPARLRKLVFLGTPQHGAPLERGGYWLDYVLDLSPYSAPFTRIGKLRSAGINDLRYGRIRREDSEPVPLPGHVKCYAAAATLGESQGTLSRQLIGDGLVPLDSALGKHSDAERTLAIPGNRQWVGQQMGHLDLLSRPEVYVQLREWLQDMA